MDYPVPCKLIDRNLNLSDTIDEYAGITWLSRSMRLAGQCKIGAEERYLELIKLDDPHTIRTDNPVLFEIDYAPHVCV